MPGVPAGKPVSSVDALSELSPANYAFLQKWIHQESGIQVGDDKMYLFQSRLVPVAKSESIASLDALCMRLREAPGEGLRRKVVEAMTTHETLFFRDPAAFDVLGATVLPELSASLQSRRLRIWSAACSSGQEPYSVAMLLLEKGFGSWDVQIHATDLSAQILARAREGRYNQAEINRGLPAAMLVKYFDRAGLDWKVKDGVRKMVQFAPGDLRHIPGNMGPFDLVFCRNVLIYFDLAAKTRILQSILRTIAPGGYLLLGAAETTMNLDTGFERRRIGSIVLYQAVRKGGKV